ncbi:MAG: hypothetical protein AAGF92_06305 [Myxococcota bacterium]
MKRAALAWIVALLPAYGCGSADCGDDFEEVDGACVCVKQCDDHEECVEAEGTAACACTTGYAGAPCEWTGAPRSPGFDDGEAWPDRANGATVEPLSEEGPTGLGIASFQASVICNAGAVSQTVEMPEYALADPFVVEITYRTEGIDLLGNGAGGVSVGYNRAFAQAPSTNGDWRNARFCLGEAAYGGEVKFQAAVSERVSFCGAADETTIDFDKFEILVAEPGECPAPGSVLNGDATLRGGGWFLGPQPTLLDPEPPTVPAPLQSGAGEAGSAGAVLLKEAGASTRAILGTRISVPTQDSMPSPTLTFWWKGSPGQAFAARFGNFWPADFTVIHTLDELFADGQGHRVTYCLPPWTHGNAVDLFFRQIISEDFETFVAEESQFVVDSVALGSDERCGTNADILDPGFESAPLRRPHAAAGWAENSVSPIRAADLARTGSGVMVMEYRTVNSFLMAVGPRLWVPPSQGDSGPQLVFYSNVPTDPGARVSWLLGLAGQTSDDLIPGGGWRRNEICVPPEWSERWYKFNVVVGNGADPVTEFDPPRQVLLDDFEIRTDSSCRAN